MGSRHRKRIAVRKADEAVRASKTPHTTRMDIDSKRRSVGPVKSSVALEWVTELVSSGHQYIKGDKAPSGSLTRQQKADNVSVRKNRSARVTSTKRGDGHPVRGDAHPVKGVEFSRDKGWQRVRTTQKGQ